MSLQHTFMPIVGIDKDTHMRRIVEIVNKKGGGNQQNRWKNLYYEKYNNGGCK